MHHGWHNAWIGICNSFCGTSGGVRVMSNAEINMHRVKSITLVARFKSNSNSRRIRIETEDGHSMDITLYGNTGKLEMLPKHKEFYDADA